MLIYDYGLTYLPIPKEYLKLKKYTTILALKRAYKASPGEIKVIRYGKLEKPLIDYFKSLSAEIKARLLFVLNGVSIKYEQLQGLFLYENSEIRILSNLLKYK